MTGIDPDFLASYSGTSGGWHEPRIGLAMDLIEQAMIDAGFSRNVREEFVSKLIKLDEALAERERT